jgi:hypothetical protein
MSWPPKIGDLLPRGAEAEGVHRKLATYSLARGHEDGGPKAYLFARLLGITHEHVDHLAEQILASVLRRPITRVRRKPPWGVGCEVVVPVIGVGIHERRVIAVTTAWELRYVGGRPRLVTAYIKGV